MIKYKIFTDGSSTVYKDKNGNRFGGIGIYFDNNIDNNISKSIYGPSVTNQKTELLACIEGINLCNKISKEKGIKKEDWSVIIYTDSLYSINCATIWSKNIWSKNNWIKSNGKEILNIEYIKLLFDLTNKYNVTFIHVKSHQPEPLNDNYNLKSIWYGNKCADGLAYNAMLSIKKELWNL